MVSFSLNKDPTGFVTLEMKFHENTDLELLFEFIRSQVEHTPSGDTSDTSSRKRTRAPQAANTEPPKTVDDLTDNEKAVINAAYLLQKPFTQARDLVPKLENDQRFSTRSENKVGAVRYLVRTLKDREVFSADGQARMLTDLGLRLAKELAGVSNVEKSSLPDFDPHERVAVRSPVRPPSWMAEESGDGE